MSEAAEEYVKQSIKYLRLAESHSSAQIHHFHQDYRTSLYAPLDKVALIAKDEAIRVAQKAAQESLNDVQKMLDLFKGKNEKLKHFEEMIQD